MGANGRTANARLLACLSGLMVIVSAGVWADDNGTDVDGHRADWIRGSFGLSVHQFARMGVLARACREERWIRAAQVLP